MCVTMYMSCCTISSKALFSDFSPLCKLSFHLLHTLVLCRTSYFFVKFRRIGVRPNFSNTQFDVRSFWRINKIIRFWKLEIFAKFQVRSSDFLCPTKPNVFDTERRTVSWRVYEVFFFFLHHYFYGKNKCMHLNFCCKKWQRPSLFLSFLHFMERWCPPF